MTYKILHHTMILTTAARKSSALDQLASDLNWPVVVNASAARLRRELSWRRLNCALFWLESPQAVPATTRLLAWLRDHAPRVYRMAVAQGNRQETEVALRMAGVHAYLPVSPDLAAAVAELLSRLPSKETRQTGSAHDHAPRPVAVNERVKSTRFPPRPWQPP